MSSIKHALDKRGDRERIREGIILHVYVHDLEYRSNVTWYASASHMHRINKVSSHPSNPHLRWLNYIPISTTAALLFRWFLYLSLSSQRFLSAKVISKAMFHTPKRIWDSFMAQQESDYHLCFFSHLCTHPRYKAIMGTLMEFWKTARVLPAVIAQFESFIVENVTVQTADLLNQYE